MLNQMMFMMFLHYSQNCIAQQHDGETPCTTKDNFIMGINSISICVAGGGTRTLVMLNEYPTGSSPPVRYVRPKYCVVVLYTCEAAALRCLATMIDLLAGVETDLAIAGIV